MMDVANIKPALATQMILSIVWPAEIASVLEQLIGKVKKDFFNDFL